MKLLWLVIVDSMPSNVKTEEQLLGLLGIVLVCASGVTAGIIVRLAYLVLWLKMECLA